VRAAAVLLLVSACSFEHGFAVFDASGSGSDTGSGSGSDAMMGSDGGGSGSDAMGSTLRQKTITIGNVVSGTLTDFPLWITLSDADLMTRARTDGTDIHFLIGGQPAAYQIQSWVKNTGKLDAWVRVPSLANGTQIVMRYGDVTVAHAPDVPGTFAGYQAVWHLDDSLTNTTVADARNLTTGTAVMLQANDSVTAQLGKGIDFNDGTDQITFTNPLSGNTAHTISFWINQRTTGSNDCVVAMGNGQMNEARWFHSRYNGNTVAVGFYTNDWDNPGENIIGGGWTLVHWVYEGNRQSRLYRDGALVAGPFMHGNNIATAGTAGSIGNAPAAFGTNMGLNATLDEVRIINVVRSTAWIAAELANQKNPATFYSVGPETP